MTWEHLGSHLEALGALFAPFLLGVLEPAWRAQEPPLKVPSGSGWRLGAGPRSVTEAPKSLEIALQAQGIESCSTFNDFGWNLARFDLDFRSTVA